jgi:hypothetical protein
MNDDIERMLRQVRPRAASPELRHRVLAAVAFELGADASLPSRLRRRPGLAVAAAVIASLALNYWVNDSLDRRLAIAFGPSPVDRQTAEIAADIASITDTYTAEWAYRRLAAARPASDEARQYPVRLQQMVKQVLVYLKETADETHQKNPQMDGDRRGSDDRHPAGAQPLHRLDPRNTA